MTSEPTPEALASRLEADRRGYLGALQRVAGPFLAAEGAPPVPIEDAPEPIRFVARRYAVDLDPAAAAAEIGLGNEELIAALAGKDRLLDRGLRPLVEGGRVPRQTWERVFPMASALGPGISTGY